MASCSSSGFRRPETACRIDERHDEHVAVGALVGGDCLDRRHAVRELEAWDDHALEDAGRVVEPMRYDAASDRYVPVTWAEAFAGIGAELRASDPDSVMFELSGRLLVP